MRGKTTSGFEYELDEAALDDYELLEDLCELDEGDTSKTISVLNRLLGKEQKDRLKEHLRSKNGRVPASKMMNEMGEIFNSVKEGKNS